MFRTWKCVPSSKTCMATTINSRVTGLAIVVKTRLPLSQRQAGIKVDIATRLEAGGTRRRSHKLLHQSAQSLQLSGVEHSVVVCVQCREFPLDHQHSYVHAVRHPRRSLDARQICTPPHRLPDKVRAQFWAVGHFAYDSTDHSCRQFKRQLKTFLFKQPCHVFQLYFNHNFQLLLVSQCMQPLARCLVYARALIQYVNFIVWVRSVNKMLPSVKFAEYKMLTFLILREKC